MVVLLGPDTDLYVYDMAQSALTTAANPSVTLSNGGPVTEKWPMLHQALKGRQILSAATVHGGKAEYLWARLKETIIFYNIDTGATQPKPDLNPISGGLMSNLQSKTIHVVISNNYVQYTLIGDLTGPKTSFHAGIQASICAKKDNSYVQAESCGGDNRPTEWNIKAGFANETHFHVIGQQVMIFEKLDTDERPKTVHTMKLDQFFLTAKTARSG